MALDDDLLEVVKALAALAEPFRTVVLDQVRALVSTWQSAVESGAIVEGVEAG